jgi:hypothetical protein
VGWQQSVIARVAAPTAVVAAVTTGLSAAVNMATADHAAGWAWPVVAVLTMASCAASLWLYRRQSITDPVTTAGKRSAVTGASSGDGHGSTVTGDHTRLAEAPGAVIGAVGDHNIQINQFHSPATVTQSATVTGDHNTIVQAGRDIHRTR